MKYDSLELIKLTDNTEVILDHSKRKARCKYCDQLIRFALTKKNNKHIPINEVDGGYQSHFDTCTKTHNISRQIDDEISTQEELNKF